MIKKASLSALLSTLFFQPIGAQPAEPAELFAANVDYCALMVAPPDGQTDEFLGRYQAALSAALSQLFKAQPGLTLNEALFALRGRCEITLHRFAGLNTH